jgi:hypothetical protein
MEICSWWIQETAQFDGFSLSAIRVVSEVNLSLVPTRVRLDEATTSMPVLQTSMITTEDSSSLAPTPTTSFQTTPNAFLLTSSPDATGSGTFGNVSNTACDLLQPCLNAGTCHNTNMKRYGYVCRCLSHLNGTECQWDHRPCQSDTCWNQGEIGCPSNLSTCSLS